MKMGKQGLRQKRRRTKATQEFLVRFLNVRKLSEPVGEPLHTYCCNDREYRDLQALLRRHGDPKELRNQKAVFGPHLGADGRKLEADDPDDVMACFVLYASEWYKR